MRDRLAPARRLRPARPPAPDHRHHGLLRSLDGPEREALLAHERAHHAGGHHYALAAAGLAAHRHPALRRVRAAVRLAAERAADEAAAASVGDRALTARAIARAALAAQAAGTTRPARPGFAPGAATGPVPQRVRALLAAPGPPPGARRAVGALLAACAVLSCAASATATADVHHRLEIAQGEETA